MAVHCWWALYDQRACSNLKLWTRRQSWFAVVVIGWPWPSLWPFHNRPEPSKLFPLGLSFLQNKSQCSFVSSPENSANVKIIADSEPNLSISAYQGPSKPIKKLRRRNYDAQSQESQDSGHCVKFVQIQPSREHCHWLLDIGLSTESTHVAGATYWAATLKPLSCKLPDRCAHFNLWALGFPASSSQAC